VTARACGDKANQVNVSANAVKQTRCRKGGRLMEFPSNGASVLTGVGGFIGSFLSSPDGHCFDENL
jgi:hypothetical protein